MSHASRVAAQLREGARDETVSEELRERLAERAEELEGEDDE